LESFDWPLTNIFGAWGTPQHRSLNMLPSHKIEACFVLPLPPSPLQFIDMEIEPWPSNMRYNTRCYWEHLRVHIQNLGGEHFGNLMGIHNEQRKKKKNKKKKTPLCPCHNPKLRIYAPM